MENLTIDKLEQKIYKPVIIETFYNNIKKVSENKSIVFYPFDSMYRVFLRDEEINRSFLAETALKYYNEITF